jgi:uncharacterized phage infection (PIP) family protein YhgE
MHQQLLEGIKANQNDIQQLVTKVTANQQQLFAKMNIIQDQLSTKMDIIQNSITEQNQNVSENSLKMPIKLW